MSDEVDIRNLAFSIQAMRDKITRNRGGIPNYELDRYLRAIEDACIEAANYIAESDKHRYG